MIRLLPALLLAFHILAAPLQAHAQSQGLQAVLQAHHDLVEDASRRTVQAVLDALAESRAGCKFERHYARVDIVVGAIDQ